MIPLKTERETDAMRRAGRILRRLLHDIERRIKPGVTTQDLDVWAENFIREYGGLPAFKGYHGFPATLCVSIENEVVHGIPDKDRVLEEGQIVGIDVGAIVDGCYGDTARTFGVGKIDDLRTKLIKCAKDALKAGIMEARHGRKLSNISHAIGRQITKQNFKAVRQYSGHGIGARLHEEPQIPNYGEPGDGPMIQAGMAFAIEPMVNVEKFEVYTAADGWTVLTEDGKPSAHFEDTVLITKNGVEVLT